MLQLFHRKPAPTGIESIIVGLGNPGREYEGTRHNTGFYVLDTLAERCGAKIDRIKFKGLTVDMELAGKHILLLKPSTYMNRSGESVREAMQFYKVPPEKVILVFDDISLEPGKLRIRRKGSDGGQNGVKNIIYLTGADTFPRIKMGIGAKPDARWDLADWVLSKFSREEAERVTEAAERACEALELMVAGQTDQAMNRYNS